MMRLLKILGALVVLMVVGLVAIGLAGSGARKQADAAAFTVSMQGTAGTAFTLQCMALQADGSSASSSYDGVVPATYPASAKILSCVGQKKGADGSLEMRLVQNDKAVKESTTSAAYGVVQAASQ